MIKNEFGLTTNFVNSAPLIHSAQRFSAGFIKFFFDQVEKPPGTNIDTNYPFKYGMTLPPGEDVFPIYLPSVMEK